MYMKNRVFTNYAYLLPTMHAVNDVMTVMRPEEGGRDFFAFSLSNTLSVRFVYKRGMC